MRTIDEIYGLMEYNVTHISEVVKKAKAEGRKVIGTFPLYAPIDLLQASGMLAIDCWGGEKVTLSRSAAYLPPFCCSLAQALTEFACAGVYNDLDAIICSIPCDTLRDNNQNVAVELKDRVPVITCAFPFDNQKVTAVPFMVADLKRIVRELEEIVGHKIREVDLRDAIDICNAFRKEILRFSDILAKNPGVATAKFRHTVMKAAGFMDRAEYTGLLKEMNDQLEQKAPVDFKGKRVYLAGIMCEPNEVLDIIDEMGMAVVGDELAHESRRYRDLVPDGVLSLERIAKAWQAIDGCTFMVEPKTPRSYYIANAAKAVHADALIYCQFALCGLDAYDYPDVRDRAIENGLKVGTIQIDQTMNTFEQVRTRLQSLKEQMEVW